MESTVEHRCNAPIFIFFLVACPHPKNEADDMFSIIVKTNVLPSSDLIIKKRKNERFALEKEIRTKSAKKKKQQKFRRTGSVKALTRRKASKREKEEKFLFYLKDSKK